MAGSLAQAALKALDAGDRPDRPSRVPGVMGNAAEATFLDRGGWESVGMVSGASVFHIGLAGFPRGNTEVAALSQAMYQAREDAISGLRGEAAAQAAVGVVNTTIDVHFMREERHLPRFVCTGTAVRPIPPMRKNDRESSVFVTDMSMAEMGLLGTSGYRPLDLVMGSCVYHVGRQRPGTWARYLRRNVELTGYTTALYDAREVAMTRLQDEARRLAAHGVVGVTTAERSHVWGSRVIEFFAMGTAVAATHDGQSPLPAMMVPVNDPSSKVDPRGIIRNGAASDKSEPKRRASGPG